MKRVVPDDREENGGGNVGHPDDGDIRVRRTGRNTTDRWRAAAVARASAIAVEGMVSGPVLRRSPGLGVGGQVRQRRTRYA